MDVYPPDDSRSVVVFKNEALRQYETEIDCKGERSDGDKPNVRVKFFDVYNTHSRLEFQAIFIALVV